MCRIESTWFCVKGFNNTLSQKMFQIIDQYCSTPLLPYTSYSTSESTWHFKCILCSRVNPPQEKTAFLAFFALMLHAICAILTKFTMGSIQLYFTSYGTIAYMSPHQFLQYFILQQQWIFSQEKEFQQHSQDNYFSVKSCPARGQSDKTNFGLNYIKNIPMRKK